MTDGKFAKLLEVLAKATEEGRVTWETTASDNAYRTLLKGGFVEIGEKLTWNDEMGEYTPPPYFAACLFDSRGRLADEIHAPQPLLERLHSLARRQALAADQLADDMLHQLAKPGRAS